MLFVVHRLHELVRKKRTAVFTCFVGLTKAYDLVDDTCCGTCCDASASPPSCFHEGIRARVQTDDEHCSEWFDVGNGLREGCNLAPLFFNLLFAGMLMVSVDEFAKDTEEMADMVKIGKPEEGTRKRGETSTMDIQDLSGMLYADDTGIVSRAPQSREKMISIILRVAGLFGRMVSKKTEITCMLPNGMDMCPCTVRAASQKYLRRIIRADRRMDKEITICRAWQCFRRNDASM